MPSQCSRPVRVRARTFTVLAHSSSSAFRSQSPCVPVHVLKEIYPAVSFLRQQQQEGHKGHKGGGCVLFRRGGIKDRGDSNSSGGSFHIKHRSFLLLPTQFHASSAILRKEHMQTHDSNKFHGYAKADHLPFQNIQLDVKAEVTQAWHVPDARECLSATATAQFHPFDPDAFAASRFKRDNSGKTNRYRTCQTILGGPSIPIFGIKNLSFFLIRFFEVLGSPSVAGGSNFDSA